jgi:hypothetical protein
MGQEVHYQAMPSDSRLLELARHKPCGFCEYFEFFRSYLRDSPDRLARMSAEDPDFAEFLHEAQLLVEQYPGLERRNLYLDRRWDKLHYLLSKHIRGLTTRDYSHWTTRAVFGSDIPNEIFGFYMSYLMPSEIPEIKSQLETVTSEMLRAHWHPPSMKAAYVYKICGDEEDEDFKWVQEDFEQLIAFYELVAGYGEGVLVFIG